MPELNDEQTRELNRGAKLLVYLNSDGIPVIWNSYAPFSDEVIIVQDSVKAINELVPKKEQSGIEDTKSKDELKQLFAQLTGGMFLITARYAAKFKDSTLAGQVTKSESDIFKLKDTEIEGFAKSLGTVIFTTDLLANTDFIPYGITLDKVTAAQNTAASFCKKIGVSQSITVISDTANIEITKNVDAMRAAVATMLDLKSNFLPDNSAFVTALEKAAVRDDIGVRHTGILPSFTLDGIDIAGGTLEIGKKTTLPSNDVGVCLPLYARAGERMVTVKLPNYPSRTFKHLLIKGHVDKMIFNFITPPVVV